MTTQSRKAGTTVESDVFYAVRVKITYGKPQVPPSQIPSSSEEGLHESQSRETVKHVH
jgi:hypothetical protein